MFFIRVFSILLFVVAVATGAQTPATTVIATPVGCASISNSWQVATGTGANAPSQYLIYRDNTNTQIGVVNHPANNFVDTAAGAYANHRYAVVTKITSGSVSPPTWSSQAATGALCPPSAPTGLTGNAVSCSQVALSWNVPANFSSVPAFAKPGFLAMEFSRFKTLR